MGLDMYLSARKYVGDWNHDKKEERDAYAEILKASGVEGYRCVGSPHVNVELSVAYWRKSNQIHKWFVDNVQEGKDECQNSYVERKDLESLLALCETAKKTKDASLLPPQSGFFFGSTSTDEYYWRDIDDTIEQLGRILGDKRLETWEFQYRASW